jgi:hypothetical protein
MKNTNIPETVTDPKNNSFNNTNVAEIVPEKNYGSPKNSTIPYYMQPGIRPSNKSIAAPPVPKMKLPGQKGGRHTRNRKNRSHRSRRNRR